MSTSSAGAVKLISTPQERWAAADKQERERILIAVGYSTSYAKMGWKALPHILKINLMKELVS